MIERLSAGKLETFIFKSQKHDKMFVKIRASAIRLREHADRVNYRLRLDEDEVKRCMIQGKRDELTGGWKWWPRSNGWVERGPTGERGARQRACQRWRGVGGIRGEPHQCDPQR